MALEKHGRGRRLAQAGDRSIALSARTRSFTAAGRPATKSVDRTQEVTPGSQPFEVITRPTELQSTVLRLLGVRL